jgi:hypothetical protein
MYCLNKEHAVILIQQTKLINSKIFSEARKTHDDVVKKAVMEFKEIA